MRPDSVPRLILASASPRRRRILAEAGFAFEVADPGAAEDALPAQGEPEAVALARARAKAEAVARNLPPGNWVVAGADTVVALGPEILGKPLDRADAERILTLLSGTRHRVITGLCVWRSARPAAPLLAAETSWVRMRPMSRAEIEAYVASGEADGKAGAYAIQETGDFFVERVEGSFLNVVGFPLERFQDLWARVLADSGPGEVR